MPIDSKHVCLSEDLKWTADCQNDAFDPQQTSCERRTG